MKRLKYIATRILRFPVEETGVGPLVLLIIIIAIMAELMKLYYH